MSYNRNLNSLLNYINFSQKSFIFIRSYFLEKTIIVSRKFTKKNCNIKKKSLSCICKFLIYIIMKKVMQESISEKMQKLDRLSKDSLNEVKGGGVVLSKPPVRPVSVTRTDRTVTGIGVTGSITF